MKYIFAVCLSILFLLGSYVNGEIVKSENVLICTLCESIMTSIDESIVDPTNEQVCDKTGRKVMLSFVLPLGNSKLLGTNM